MLTGAGFKSPRKKEKTGNGGSKSPWGGRQKVNKGKQVESQKEKKNKKNCEPT